MAERLIDVYKRQRLSVHFGWQCDNVRASYDEISKATQDEVFAGAKAFVKENKDRYECGGYIYSGAVSYTHLDVYKRQIPYNEVLPPRFFTILIKYVDKDVEAANINANATRIIKKVL